MSPGSVCIDGHVNARVTLRGLRYKGLRHELRIEGVHIAYIPPLTVLQIVGESSPKMEPGPLAKLEAV